MLVKIKSFALQGLDPVPIDVEVDVTQRGLPSFSIVGLPDTAVQESRERVRSALKNNGFQFPMHRITVNLAPADIKKEGAFYAPSFTLIANEYLHTLHTSIRINRQVLYRSYT